MILCSGGFLDGKSAGSWSQSNLVETTFAGGCLVLVKCNAKIMERRPHSRWTRMIFQSYPVLVLAHLQEKTSMSCISTLTPTAYSERCSQIIFDFSVLTINIHLHWYSIFLYIDHQYYFALIINIYPHYSSIFLCIDHQHFSALIINTSLHWSSIFLCIDHLYLHSATPAALSLVMDLCQLVRWRGEFWIKRHILDKTPHSVDVYHTLFRMVEPTIVNCQALFKMLISSYARKPLLTFLLRNLAKALQILSTLPCTIVLLLAPPDFSQFDRCVFT